MQTGTQGTVTVLAPPNAGAVMLALEDGPFRVEPKDGAAEVPAAVAEVLVREHGWDRRSLVHTMPEEELQQLRERHEFLTERAGALQDELEGATAKVAELRSTAARIRADVREGDAATSDVVAADRGVRDAVEVVDALHDSIAKVQAELAGVERKIENEEAERSKRKQMEDAAPLLDQADAIRRDFIRQMTTLRDPLLQLEQLRVAIRRDYPRAPLPEAPTLEALAREVRKAWPAKDVAGNGAHRMAFQEWLRVVLQGPVVTASDALITRLGG